MQDLAQTQMGSLNKMKIVNLTLSAVHTIGWLIFFGYGIGAGFPMVSLCCLFIAACGSALLGLMYIRNMIH
jgi:hypothetical protein